MQRRTALRQLATLLGGVTLTPELMARTLASATTGQYPQHITADKMAVLAEIAETIIPETDTPGAKAAGVPAFIALMIEDCTAPDEQKVFWAGLDDTERQCKAAYGKSFVDCSSQQRIELLTKVESAAKASPNFWQIVKGLTLFGYFSSEIGMTQALAYDPIPGGWIPELPIDENTKAWASMF